LATPQSAFNMITPEIIGVNTENSNKYWLPRPRYLKDLNMFAVITDLSQEKG